MGGSGVQEGGGKVTVSVMVVDDHPMWREGVARDLAERGFEIVATAGDAASAVRIAKAVRPNVVLMDLNLGELSGVDATLMITGELPETRVLVLSASGEHDDVLQAVKAGASGYLVKSASADELVDAVTRTAEDEDAPKLTPRETEVLRLVAKGLTAKQVAERLGLSHRTVENHVQNTLSKLQLHNRAQLVRYAVEKGLAD